MFLLRRKRFKIGLIGCVWLALLFIGGLTLSEVSPTWESSYGQFAKGA